MSAAFTSVTGQVEEFDDARGLGRVTADNTGETWFFHCTRIANGHRTIPVGVAVTFDIMLGPTGLEAVAVAPIR